MPETPEDYLHRLTDWARQGIATVLLVVGLAAAFAVMVVAGLTGSFPVTLAVVGGLVLAASFMVGTAQVPTPVAGRRTAAEESGA